MKIDENQLKTSENCEKPWKTVKNCLNSDEKIVNWGKKHFDEEKNSICDQTQKLKKI